MKVNFLKRTTMMSVIGLVALLGTSVIANAQRRVQQGRLPEQRPITEPQRKRQIEPLQQQPQQPQQWPQRQAAQRQRAQQQRILEQQRYQQQLALRRQQQQQLEQQRLERLRQQQQQQMRRNNARNNRNQSVYTNPGGRHYRVYRNGGYYQTDQNGVTALRQAVNYGYQQGIRAGQQDSAYGRGFNYQNSAVYQNGTYGYSHVDSNEYRYYFREGFRRGYEDGYNRRSQYGSNSNGTVNILAAILQQLLNVEAF